ncbi:MAG: UvrD-helicase domain-containing protein, partial [Myxococcota bacterium]
MLYLAQRLNTEQYEAATTTEGPLLVLAGAGSGKTRVLVYRIAHIVSEGKAAPWQIFAVTFTNKAAREMQTRLRDLLGEQVESAWIGTFHSLCARMLRVEGRRLGFDPGFTIYDADDSKRLLKTIMEESGIDGSSHGTPVNAVSGEIDRAKNAGLTPKAFANRPIKFETPAYRAARRVYPKYQKALAQANAMDFGDLLLWALELLKHHPEAKRRFADRFKYVLVDEFQDTNRVQYALLQQLVDGHNNLAVVGDDDQSIYR